MNPKNHPSDWSTKTSEVLELIAKGRKRTNLLRGPEQRAIAWLVQKVPAWMSSDMLSAIGFFGSFMVFGSFLMAGWLTRPLLLLGVAGFLISWLGDSLDGRLAYYRGIPRKWYGFTLDITIDWLSILLIGAGFIIYVDGPWELAGYFFVVMYGWEIILALIRYRITNEYSIDSGIMSPTEVRIIVSAILVVEVIWPGSMQYVSVVLCVVLLVVNILDSYKLLGIADRKDQEEKNVRRVEGEDQD